MEEEEALDEEVENQTPAKPKAGKVRLVETEVRRSSRLKVRNKGFKSTGCTKINCVGCSNKPPTLSIAVIRNLGKELAQIDPELLTDDNLMKKKETAPTGIKKNNDKKNKSKKKDEDKKDQPENKNKKKDEDKKDQPDA
ncbi:hypothetical protein BDA96_01G544200 [Sorghum bicolor]|jgi:hypothetical protein|uniref:Uncharacterized protein n=2 Tax=Sorghum bicolor TaxID=4558 RepID=A0A921S7M3_SORBI|nr:uncharacterized protein DDB_G0288629-like [Sorghum bicolor]KAG0552859.1 hypothetical protein BDA96_01G544200 [Sorghum bicolor]KXG40212.1 hypothetical protein SORBI_3001G509400 [Sorghum bicolor]|eukprot:XP_021307181.1 uncharacterized protein DDB_G0288629-like [Sorghum bicolor]